MKEKKNVGLALMRRRKLIYSFVTSWEHIRWKVYILSRFVYHVSSLFRLFSESFW